jgi:hypothetical protein
LAPRPVKETYRLIPLLAAQILLDSPFKVPTIRNLDGKATFFNKEAECMIRIQKLRLDVHAENLQI